MCRNERYNRGVRKRKENDEVEEAQRFLSNSQTYIQRIKKKKR